MKERLDCILLVDDCVADNYLHKRILKELDCCKQIMVARDGEEALKVLTTKKGDVYLSPDLIFLDINMPKMTGWEFLEEYKRLPLTQQAKAVVIMLTTSLNPSDKERADNIDEVSGFLNKPLTINTAMHIFEQFFQEHF